MRVKVRDIPVEKARLVVAAANEHFDDDFLATYEIEINEMEYERILKSSEGSIEDNIKLAKLGVSEVVEKATEPLSPQEIARRLQVCRDCDDWLGDDELNARVQCDKKKCKACEGWVNIKTRCPAGFWETTS